MRTDTTYRELLATILDALDVPHPADVRKEDEWHALIVERALVVVCDLRIHLRDDSVYSRVRSGEEKVSDSIGWIRDKVAGHPVTYEVADRESTKQPT